MSKTHKLPATILYFLAKNQTLARVTIILILFVVASKILCLTFTFSQEYSRKFV